MLQRPHVVRKESSQCVHDYISPCLGLGRPGGSAAVAFITQACRSESPPSIYRKTICQFTLKRIEGRTSKVKKRDERTNALS